ncbi:uncharacterized protein ARMOST_13821 [Armillaria ostoyae]|uniref:RNA-directed DNA polymerase n=1 Tax=Armillaria ostoyae TaxID=47428 RepID=A0A284RNZ5_ARMOS|nr:uncharacterized protein ARMOST_13821 [Armillaria ostoyae]
MTPDELSILIAGLIGGSALLSLFVALIVLTYAEQLRRIFRIRPLAPVTPALPGHYVLPYLQPGPLMEPVGPIHAPTPQRRATFAATASDDDLPVPPRNATPGPSNVPRTPPPAYDPAETEEYGRFLRAIFRSPSPTDLPLITIPDSPPTPVRPLLPESDNPSPSSSTPFGRESIYRTLPPGRIEFGTPAHLCPLPDSDNESDSNSDPASYGGNEPVAERDDDDPLNPNGADYEWPELDAVDRAFLGPYRSQAWELRRLDIEQRSRYEGPENRVRMGYYLATERGPRIPRRGREATIPSSWMPAHEPTQSSKLSPTSYWPSHLPRPTVPTWTEPPDFDNFNQDQETFGGWAEEESDGEFDTYQDDRDYRGYTTAPHFYRNPFPLPDSPTYLAPNHPPPPPHPRWIQQFRPPQYGSYAYGGQGPDDPEPGGSAMPTDPPQPSNTERLEAARQQSLANRREYDVLKAQMEAAQAKMMTHDVTWDFAQPPDSKGKEPDRGRPLVPNYRRPLYDRTDRWSVPRPPPKWQAPNPYPAPVGVAPDEAPWLGVKPIMVKPPLPFFGKYDDIERFIGDCLTYFEVFASYFQVPSSRVVFAVTHLEGDAKDWWVHARQDFWANDEGDPIDARFRFPSWTEFTTLLALNFHDPASEEMHEKKMFDLRMGKGSALAYFQELEVEAKKANRRGETDARGLMVKAVRLGVPDSYTNAIANSGQHIPVTYNDWKRRICIMYEERQKKWVFDQTIGGRSAPQNRGATAPSQPKAGGATSSTPPKQAGNSSAPKTGGRDSAGRWTTHPGQGLPMSVDAQKLRDEGQCFRCKEKGHLSRDCPKKKEFRDIRSVQATELAVTTKVEEDLLTGAHSSSAGRSHGLFVGTPFNPTCIIKRTDTFLAHSDTDSIDTYSRTPASNFTAFNVSSTTSKPVPESQNRYATLSVEECNNDSDSDTPLKGCHDTSPARAEAKADNPAGHEAESLSTRPLLTLGQTDANHRASSLCGETQSTNASGEKSTLAVTPIDIASLPRITDGTMSAPKGKLYEEAAQVERPSTPKVDVESQLGGETTARLPGQQRVPTTTSSDEREGCCSPRDGDKKARAGNSDGQGETGNSTFAVQAQPATLRSGLPSTRDGDRSILPRNEPGSAKAQKRPAAGLEAASAQAVNRGHSVTCIEVPDEDDDTAFQIWLAKERLPTVTQMEATSDEPARSSTKPITFQKWYKPFEVDWTLRAVCEARNDNAARAALYVWTHVDRVPKLTSELLSKLRKGDELAREHLYELREPPRYLRRRQSSSRDFMLDVQLTTLTNRQVFATRGLVDSGCTSSAINRAFVQKHRLDTVKTAIPIIVYNADGSRNKGGDITEYVEVRLTIGNHEERIDLAVTDLGAKDLYLGHDWLKRHNPVINWETSTVIFGRCHCVKNPFPLPDADPDDRWDEELEDGDTILAVNMEEEIVIRAMHHANDLAAAANAEKPTKTFEEMVPPDYRSFRDLFSKENFDELPERKPWDHAIELVPNAKSTLDCKVYPLNRNEQEQLDKFLDENLDSGRIKESKSPFASPFFFVKKKDGTLRPVQDYRKLNEMTIKNRYPLPLISELIDKLQGAKYFIKLDVRWGYNNVRIKEGDEHKAAFRTNRGLFEPTVMFFGLTNSPATFQWMMNDIFKDLISEGKVTIYLDDILIFTKDLDEHRRIVRRVLQKLRENKLFLKAEKCEFEVLETEYLGVIISEGQVRMDPVKLAGIAEWPTPTKKKELQSFLGFTNFYRKFIKNYSKVVRALTQLTGNAEWTWGAAQNQAFQQLKKQMAEDVILAIPNRTGRFRVEADASNGAIGAVLSQEQEDRWRPVAFMSKALTATERNYEIYDKELLAIMLALSEWRHYLMGALEDVEIWTDHQNLQYFRKPQKLNRRQARWVTELAEYHFILKHKPGTANVKADLLSRRSDHDQGEDDNGDITVLSPEHFRAMIMPTPSEIHERVRTATRQKELWDKGIAASLEHERGITEKDGILYYDNRTYVPRHSALRGEIIAQSHDHITAGHPGIAKTRELVQREYWWPKIQKDIEAYVKGCETCQRTKSNTQAKSAPLHPNAIPTEPWTHVSVDMVTGLPDSNGHDALLVVVDRFSKAIILVPCNVELSAAGWARTLRDHVYAHHGMPQVVISDRGPQFVSAFMKELYRMLDITQNASTAFHPQTDGQTERVNQEVEKYLRIFINYHQNDWADWLPLAEFAHNNRAHSATGRSPFMILYGRNPRIMPDSPRTLNAKVPAASDFSKAIAQIHKETELALEQAAGRMKAQYDKHKRPAQEYHAGDKVWLDATNLHLPRPKKKLDDKRVGPFLVLEKTGASAYKLKLPPHWKIHPRFNEKLLSPFTPPSFPNQEQPPPPPPDLIDGEEEWEIEEILDSKSRKVRAKRGEPSTTVIDYFIKWVGHTREHNSWVTASEMGNTQEAIADYETKMGSNERVSVVKIATSKSPLAMVLDHHFDGEDISYLCQREDGTQKWVKNPDITLFENFLVEYWSNYEYHSLQRTKP